MEITPTKLTISQLFNNRNEQFSIPAYQRRYAWGDKQVGELFEDIARLKENETHFFGTILLLTDSHRADLNSLEVVDGQQRIITLSILLKAIQDRINELKEEEASKDIDSHLYCQGLDRKKQNKIILGDLDEPDYYRVLNLENIEEIKNKNLIQAYNTIKNLISKDDFEKLNKFLFKLLHKSIVIRLDTQKANDAYKLFETINNRGLRLSPTDIIKNFILGHSSLINENTLKKVRENWKELIINLDGISTDAFFRQVLCGSLKQKITYKKLISEFKKYYIGMVKESEMLPEARYIDYFEEENGDLEESNGDGPIIVKERNKIIKSKKNKRKISIIEFSNMLKETSLIYKKINKKSFDNKKINQHIDNLQRIEAFPTYIFLLNLFKKNIEDSQKIEILKILCEKRTSELDDIFSKLTEGGDENIVERVKKASRISSRR